MLDSKVLRMKTILLVGIGGAIGSILRYLTTLLVSRFWSAHFPLATFLTNVLGCFLIGLFVGILDKNHLTESQWKWFLITGFCGGYTTFSTFANENFSLFRDQFHLMALAYIAASVCIGLLAVWFGLFVTKL